MNDMKTEPKPVIAATDVRGPNPAAMREQLETVRAFVQEMRELREAEEESRKVRLPVPGEAVKMAETVHDIIAKLEPFSIERRVSIMNSVMALYGMHPNPNLDHDHE
jgi:hypothetical protein